MNDGLSTDESGFEAAQIQLKLHPLNQLLVCHAQFWTVSLYIYSSKGNQLMTSKWIISRWYHVKSPCSLSSSGWVLQPCSYELHLKEGSALGSSFDGVSFRTKPFMLQVPPQLATLPPFLFPPFSTPFSRTFFLLLLPLGLFLSLLSRLFH